VSSGNSTNQQPWIRGISETDFNFTIAVFESLGQAANFVEVFGGSAPECQSYASTLKARN
jgi:hypothetical protein